MRTNDIHIALPASKSISNRWLVVNHFENGAFRLSGLSTADDTVLLRGLLSQVASHSSSVFYCHNAGTVARFMAAVLAITPGYHYLTGDDRLKQRPIAPLVDALNSMGFNVRYADKEGFLPLNIQGCQPIRKMVSIDASQSSQFVSALMLLGIAMPDGIRIMPKSKVASSSYVDMTLQVLKEAGYPVAQHPTSRVITVDPKPQKDADARSIINIEPDWSSAGFFYEAALMCPQSRFRLTGLSLRSIQGDSVASSYFAKLGVSTTEVRSPFLKTSNSLLIHGGGPSSRRVYFSFRKCPDLVPAVAVACAYLGIGATLAGISTLRLKESDRVEALLAELRSLGSRIEVNASGDIVLHASKKGLHPTRAIHTYADHRIAMAFAPLSLVIPDLEFDDKSAVSKSFPDFWNQLSLCKR
ncbi:MAG: 3-phosphoshikimate 1-carboxyvinyltransferase [Bacteroidales bacterium]|nr:3-phosphoshikimate 1-carboxyvinyltransferase [Bacteroidales bacterium]